mmetsp:Transcript_2218/g.2939  ORF Transcript_2218/g.2939 Transcript_2218/m.2939 type:complete len:91 (+) Transcript_2218:2-274(+)
MILLFFIRVEYDSSVPATFQQARQHSNGETDCDQQLIKWVNVNTILEAVSNNQPLFPNQDIMKFFRTILLHKPLQDVLKSHFRILESFEQ